MGMTGRERVRAIIAGKPADRCGSWIGNPHPDTWPIYHAYFGTQTEEELRLLLHDDIRWVRPHHVKGIYRHPEGKGFFDLWRYKPSLGDPGPLASCEDVRAVDEYEWPRVEWLHFDNCIAALKASGDFYHASGFWSPFFHDIADLFGMEQYLMKMYTHPEVVDAVTDRVCGFYYEANERLFDAAGDLIDGFFFGNDFGTQSSLLVSPDMFDRFMFPWVKRFAAQARRRGYQVLLHSCGSVHDLIGRFIEAGVQCLHPLQARAAQMDAETLAHNFGGMISFLGGVDTQQLLVDGTPGEVRAEVFRLKELLGPRLIVSPSHEALLPNVPPENVLAMTEAAIGQRA